MNPFQEYDPREKAFCSIGAAIIGAGALGAGASIWSASTAADAQRDASGRAIDAQRGMFNEAKAANQPFIDAGKGGIPQLNSWLDRSDPNSPLAQLLRLTTPGADQNAALEQTPGFQFSREQGMKAVTSGLAARGLGGPGGALAKGGANFAEGLAGNTWKDVVTALQNSFSSGGNALQSLVNTGASSAQSLGGQAIQAGQGISNNIIGAGNATAGAATATGNAISGFGNSVSSAVLLQKLLGNQNNQNNAGLYGPNRLTDVAGGVG